MFSSLLCARLLRVATSRTATAKATQIAFCRTGSPLSRLRRMIDDHPPKDHRRLRHGIAAEVLIHTAARRGDNHEAARCVAGPLASQGLLVGRGRVVAARFTAAVALQTIAVE